MKEKKSRIFLIIYAANVIFFPYFFSFFLDINAADTIIKIYIHHADMITNVRSIER